MATTADTRVATPTAAAGAAGDGAAPKKSKKKVIIAVAILVLGGGAYYKLGMKASAKPTAPVEGIVIPMDVTTLNLADGHFLKVKVALQGTKAAKAELDTSKAADIVINEFTNRTMASMVTTAERAAIKKDLEKQLSGAYPKEIMGVYLTQFVMQ